MEAYRNRPLMDPDTPVWRYLSLDALIATVHDRQLRFTRVDTFADPFEGSVPKQQIDDQVALFAGAYEMRMMYGSVAAHYPAGASGGDLAGCHLLDGWEPTRLISIVPFLYARQQAQRRPKNRRAEKA
jgi:hypothetical protein